MVDRNVDVGLRWYCGTCGVSGIIWHPPAMSCVEKPAAIAREHARLEFGCEKFDYRIVSDSETRPKEKENERLTIF